MMFVWDLLSDEKILDYLKDVNREIDRDVSRMLFIELFRRLKSLEEDNLTCRVLLEEMGIVDEELFKRARSAVRDFLKQKDEQKTKESDFFSATGIPFPEWVNFKLHGTFNGPGAE